MKLHWSPRSPYVRKVMIVAHERGLVERIKIIPTHVAMDKANQEYMGTNPLSKIPTLLIDDGSALFDSRVIAEYLDGLGDGEPLFPHESTRRFQALSWMGLAEGLTDALILWRNERTRPETLQSLPHHAAFEAKRNAAFARLNEIAPTLANTPFGIGHIAIGIVNAYSDFRFPEYNWRALHPALNDWHITFQARPSVQATEPKAEH
jgi:glutathione S-transferase